MSDSKFPLCESVGLALVSETFPVGRSEVTQYYIDAAYVEALLAKGVRLIADRSKPIVNWTENYAIGVATHTALLIDIKPIKRERKCELSESEVREALMSAHIGSRKEDIIDRFFGEESE